METHTILLLVISLLMKVSVLSCDKGDVNDAVISDTLKNMLKNYDTRLRPNYTGDATYVYVDFSVLSFGHISERDMETILSYFTKNVTGGETRGYQRLPLREIFPVDMFFRQRWNDHRLKHNLSKSLVLTMGKKHPADIIWVPDTVFINAYNARMHHVTVSNDKLDIYPDGKVFWGSRITVTGSCKLDLRSYPMDTQTCSLGVESYAYPGDHIQYKWAQPIKILDKEMSQYQMVQYFTKETKVTYVAGSYSILNATFTFQRRTGHSIIQIYIPTIAIVCVSWFSLWIDKNATAARIALSVTTLLTLTTIWGAVNSTLPRVSYIKAVDIFFLVSFSFVFCVLIEYTLVVNVSARARKRKYRQRLKLKAKRSSQKDDEQPFLNGSMSQSTSDRPFGETIFTPKDGLQNAIPLTERKGNNFCEDTRTKGCYSVSPIHVFHRNSSFRRQSKNSVQNYNYDDDDDPIPGRPNMFMDFETSTIDLIARVLFPVGYMIFNILYWMKYLKPPRDISP